MEKKNILVQVLIFIFLLFITLTFLYPLLFMVLNSLKTTPAYYADSFGLPEGPLEYNNYLTMFSQFKILVLFKNTTFILIVTCAVTLLLTVFASYAFSKLVFPGKNKLFLGIIATMLVPAQVTLIPMYIMFSKADLINSPWSVILVYIAGFLPGNVLLMTSFFKGISNELLEAGTIDGCNYFQTVGSIVVPLGKPVILISLIFNAVSVWNDLFTPMVFLQKTESKTVMVALAGLIQRYDQDPTFQYAGLVLCSVPIVLFYILMQRHIVEGITMGSIK